MYTGTRGERHIWSTFVQALFITSKTWRAVQHFTDWFLDVLGLQWVPWPLSAAKEMLNLMLKHQWVKRFLRLFLPLLLVAYGRLHQSCQISETEAELIIIHQACVISNQDQICVGKPVLAFAKEWLPGLFTPGVPLPLYCGSHFVILAQPRCRLFGSILTLGPHDFHVLW